MADVAAVAVTHGSGSGRLLRFAFASPPLGGVPVTARLNLFAARLAKSAPDLVSRLGVVRSLAYYDRGCPDELCDHAAARDLWAALYPDCGTEPNL